MQALIDAGAYVVFIDEENGLEMLAEYTKSVGADTVASKKITLDKDRVFRLRKIVSQDLIHDISNLPTSTPIK